MSDNNLHRIFAATSCISTEMMKDYIKGKLSEKEKNIVEVHLSSCEMCRDEFEGLSYLNDNTKLTQIVTNLDQKIDERINSGGKKIIFRKQLLRIAAAILILITSAWLITIYFESSVLKMDSETVSQALEEKSTEKKEIQPPSVIEKEQAFETKIEEKSPVETQHLKRESEKTVKSETGKIIDDTEISRDKELLEKENPAKGRVVMENESIALNDYMANKETIGIVTEEAIENEKMKEDRSKVQEEDSDITYEKADDLAENADYKDNFREDVKTENQIVNRGGKRRSNKKLAKAEQEPVAGFSTTNTVRTDNFKLAMTQYNKRAYEEAIVLFKKSLPEHSKQDEVYFYLAKSYSNINDTDKAIYNYNKVIAQQGGPYYEVALWNKSQLLLEINKKRSAKNSLNQLRNYQGSYREKADKMLDSLEKKKVIIESDIGY